MLQALDIPSFSLFSGVSPPNPDTFLSNPERPLNRSGRIKKPPSLVVAVLPVRLRVKFDLLID
jgi:hypothetical protein